MDNEALKKEVEKLRRELDLLKQKRVYQQDIIPDAVKTRHMGEPNRFFVSGLAADRPTSGYEITGGTLFYFAIDTDVLSIWNGDAWVSETFT